jgi:hypothetical protein
MQTFAATFALNFVVKGTSVASSAPFNIVIYEYLSVRYLEKAPKMRYNGIRQGT